MRTSVKAIVAGWAVLLFAASGWAYQIEDVRVEWWTGTGSHTALLVVDFGRDNGQSDSFAFGYHFSQDSITGRALLDGIQAANRGFSYAAPGGFLTDITYVKNGVTYHVSYSWPLWWKYFLSDDSGSTWIESEEGLELRVLFDGDSDAWLPVVGWEDPSVPVTPVLGDMNCDGVVSFADINPFVEAMVSPAAYAESYPMCSLYNADMNADGLVNFADINPFVAMFQP
jgi:hypothetical protein